MSLPKLYLETTIPSYLTAWPSGSAVIAGHQQTTREWWVNCRERFDLHISQFVLDEASLGDPEAARQRLNVIEGLPKLDITPRVTELADALIAEGAVPAVAATDALHIAVAAVHGMNFIVTWNFRHIANATMEPLIRKTCHRHGWQCPEICTPEQLLPEDKGETL